MVLSLCLVSVIAGVFRMLVPAGNLQRTSVMVVGIFTLVCFLSPFTGGVDFDSLFSFSLEELSPNNQLLGEYEYDLEQAAVEEVTAAVEQVAKEQGVSATVTGVQIEQRDTDFFVEKITLMVDGTQTQAVALKERILNVVKCEVSLAWTKESVQ